MERYLAALALRSAARPHQPLSRAYYCTGWQAVNFRFLPVALFGLCCFPRLSALIYVYIYIYLYTYHSYLCNVQRCIANIYTGGYIYIYIKYPSILAWVADEEDWGESEALSLAKLPALG